MSDEQAALDRLALGRLRLRFLGAMVQPWYGAGGGDLEWIEPREVLPGEVPQLEIAEVLTGPTYRVPWRKVIWPDRFACRAAVVLHVPACRAIFYRQGSARWFLPPPHETRLIVVSGPGRKPFEVTMLQAGICHKPGSWVGCKVRILWVLTARGKRMPVNWTPRSDGRFVSHWSTCPHARYFRTSPA